ncbi:hypothetical protein GHT06_010085 [Daphnia sinensis]|uniref:Uncharacterized protein n=1 Tax=Daphnia sinensis TaxID=1820382 RepID=A0AAD5LH76_9CRUS|nr:hypothetical protein GHT06_010085 [Daphnia sinensis]
MEVHMDCEASLEQHRDWAKLLRSMENTGMVRISIPNTIHAEIKNKYISSPIYTVEKEFVLYPESNAAGKEEAVIIVLVALGCWTMTSQSIHVSYRYASAQYSRVTPPSADGLIMTSNLRPNRWTSFNATSSNDTVNRRIFFHETSGHNNSACNICCAVESVAKHIPYQPVQLFIQPFKDGCPGNGLSSGHPSALFHNSPCLDVRKSTRPAMTCKYSFKFNKL